MELEFWTINLGRPQTRATVHSNGFVLLYVAETGCLTATADLRLGNLVMRRAGSMTDCIQQLKLRTVMSQAELEVELADNLPEGHRFQRDLTMGMGHIALRVVRASA